MTLKEVDYFDSTIERIKWLLNWYQNVHFGTKQFRIFLANGERILYKCSKDKLPHLLGVDTDFLASTRFFKSASSYELLVEFLNNPFSLREKIKKGEININSIFSKHIDQKIQNFKLNISINQENILFVIKYDPKVVFNRGMEKRNCDYIMFKKIDDGSILELDLKLNNKYAVPVSNRMYNDEFESEDSLKEVLTDQEATIVSSIIFENEYLYSNKKLLISDQDKIYRLQLLKNLKLKYNCHIDVSGDCSYYYGRNFDNRTIGRSNSDILDKIMDCVLEGKIIDEKSLNITFDDLSNQQRDLIDILNDRMLYGGNSIKSNEEAYSSLRKKCATLEKLKAELEEKNKQLISDNGDLKKQLDTVNIENENHRQFVKQIIKTVKNFENEEK